MQEETPPGTGQTSGSKAKPTEHHGARPATVPAAAAGPLPSPCTMPWTSPSVLCHARRCGDIARTGTAGEVSAGRRPLCLSLLSTADSPFPAQLGNLRRVRIGGRRTGRPQRRQGTGRTERPAEPDRGTQGVRGLPREPRSEQPHVGGGRRRRAVVDCRANASARTRTPPRSALTACVPHRPHPTPSQPSAPSASWVASSRLRVAIASGSQPGRGSEASSSRV